jgi:hypothetical protein
MRTAKMTRTAAPEAPSGRHWKIVVCAMLGMRQVGIDSRGHQPGLRRDVHVSNPKSNVDTVGNHPTLRQPIPRLF